MRIFISYSRRDSAFTERLIGVLEAHGHDVWLDTADIRGSDEWRQSIAAAIRDAEVVVLVISPRSMASAQVDREVNVAAEERRRIVPVVLEHADLTGSIRYQLAGVQTVSFDGRPFEDASERLLEALGGTVDRARLRSEPERVLAPNPTPSRVAPRLAALGLIFAVGIAGVMFVMLFGNGPVAPKPSRNLSIAPPIGGCVLTVTFPFVNLQAEPNHASEVIGSVPEGEYRPDGSTLVSWASRQERWFKINVAGRSGWVWYDPNALGPKSGGCP